MHMLMICSLTVQLRIAIVTQDVLTKRSHLGDATVL